MLSQTLFRSLLRAPRTIPRAVPRAHISPKAPFRQVPSIRTYAQWPRPPRRVWGRVTREEVIEETRRAKPLITNDQIRRFFRSSGLKAGIVVFVSGSAYFYYSNLEYVPISGRRRFNFLSDEWVEEEGKMMYDKIMQENRNCILPDWDRRARQVRRVMERLIPASGVDNVAWEVHVINSPERNAFVIPGGKVFVYAGILPITKNDDGLAAVLGHEIAHNVARHQAEQMSSMIWLFPVRWLLNLTDGIGYTMGLGRFLGDLFLQFGVQLPASRKQETEADYIGLLMMAKSCFNPSEAIRVWERMEAADKEGSGFPEWLSTHPSNVNRITQMQKWLQEAEDARAESGCAASVQQSRAFQDAVGSLVVGNWT